MAADVALLKLSRQPVLRLYSWSPWAISLGYHQNLSDINLQKCRDDCIDVVRRPTGGRAILHAEELTYCVVLPVHHPWQQESVNDVYKRLSGALLQGLQNFGVGAISLVKSQSAHRGYAENGACFASSVNYEISAMQRKLIGSAQRRFKEGILQHGSLLIGPEHEQLDRYFIDPPDNASISLQSRATCLSRVLGYKPDTKKLEAALVEGFSSYVNIRFLKSKMTAEEKKLAEKLTGTFHKREVVV